MPQAVDETAAGPKSVAPTRLLSDEELCRLFRVPPDSLDPRAVVRRLESGSVAGGAAAAKTVPVVPLSAEAASKRFGRDLFLDFQDLLCDGFYLANSKDGSNRLLLDAAADSDLSQCIVNARNLLRMHAGCERRARVLGRFVAVRMGGGSATADKLREITSAGVMPLGRLLSERNGLSVHRALLYKYLADLTVRSPARWSSSRGKPEPIHCSIKIDPANGAVTCSVLVDGQRCSCDLMADPIKITNPTGAQIQETKSEMLGLGDGEGLRLRIAYGEVAEYEGLKPGMGIGKWRGRTVTVMSTVAGRMYDTARFVGDMEALAAARHNHIAHVLAIAHVPAIAHTKGKSNSEELLSAPVLGQRPGRPVPQMIALFEHLRGPTLADVIRRGGAGVGAEERVRVCLQIAQAVGHLHSLLMPYGNLNSATVRLDERLSDAKLSGLDLSRYAAPLSEAKEDSEPKEDSEARAEGDASAQAGAAYWAPERLIDPQTITSAADVYAFGCVLFAIFMHAEPFAGMYFEAIRTAVLAGTRPMIMTDLTRTGHDAVPFDMARLVEDCLRAAPRERPTIDMCIERIRSCIDLKKLLAITTSNQWPARPNANANANAAAPAASPLPLAKDSKDPPAPSPSSLSPPPPFASPPPPLSFSLSSSSASPHAADSKGLMDRLESPLMPLNPEFGDGASVEACDAAREAALSKLGLIDKKMLIGEYVSTCSMYIIHRTHSGNVALVTRGLSDPSNDASTSYGTTGLGIELLAEAKEADVGTGAVLGASYLFQMMHEVAGNCRQFGLKLRQLIDVHQWVSMELNNVDAPPPFTDRMSNRTCVLLGVESPDVPDSFTMPGNLKVRIVTVKLLTFEECLLIRRFGPAGRKALADSFARERSHHVSTIRHNRESINGVMQHLKTPTMTPAASEHPPTPQMGVEFFRNGPCATESIAWDPEKVRKRLADLQQLQAAPRPNLQPVAAVPPVDAKAGGPPVAAVPPSTGGRNLAEMARGIIARPLASSAFSLATAFAAALKSPAAPGPASPASSASASAAAAPPARLLGGSSELDVNALFSSFARPTPVSSAMCRFDTRLRELVLGPAGGSGASASPITTAGTLSMAKHVMSVLATHTQLAGWKHVQDYIINPKAYLEEIKAPRKNGPTLDPSRAIDVLQTTGNTLVRRLLLRLQWLLDLHTRAREEFDPDFFLAVLSGDGAWMDESGAFTRESELTVTDLLKHNAQRFAAFRDLQKRGVQWPHSPRTRKDIESAGFVFRPMMVKRDRCVCDACGVELAGWRPWHNPWQLHNLARHTPDFVERVYRFGAAFPQTGAYTFTIAPPTATGANTNGAAGTATFTSNAAAAPLGPNTPPRP